MLLTSFTPSCENETSSTKPEVAYYKGCHFAKAGPGQEKQKQQPQLLKADFKIQKNILKHVFIL